MDENKTNINWFPGHMTKTWRLMEKTLPSVDAIAEQRDARIPYASANPDLDKRIGSKPRLVILNKCSMADPDVTQQWIRYFKQNDIPAIPVDSRTGAGVQAFVPAVEDLLQDKRRAMAQKGMVNRPLYIMVVGIPNVGKSSFINRMAHGSKARVEDRPGVTRGNQWFTVSSGLRLLDTPGVLWPKFTDKTVAAHLAFTGAIRDEVLNCEELACGLYSVLAQTYPQQLAARYKLDPLPEDPYQALQQIAQKRGMRLSGGEWDLERAARTLLDEFRGAVIGKISLERPGVRKG